MSRSGGGTAIGEGRAGDQGCRVALLRPRAWMRRPFDVHGVSSVGGG